MLRAIATDPRFERFRRAFQRYLDDWGFRCSEELMLTSPSFQESPEPVIDMIRAYARLGDHSPSDALRAQATDREDATRRTHAELQGRVVWRGLPVTYSVLLGVVLPWTHAAIRSVSARDSNKRCSTAGVAGSRWQLARSWFAGRRSSERRRRLLPHRVRAVGSHGRRRNVPAGDALARRGRVRAEHRAASATSPPDAFTLPEGEYLDAKSSSRARWLSRMVSSVAPARAAGASPGRASVLRDVTEAGRLERGDVLVTKQTDPGWVPVFFLIAGLVIERGGMLSHGAIIAREFGIPCVVGVKGSTTRIPSGSTITVDGDRGEVHEAHVID